MFLQRDNVGVEWVNLGEGWNGDYDEDDPNDVNLLRFDVMIYEEAWEHLDDASYCTQVPADTSPERLKELAQIIMDEVYEPASSGTSIKRICERLSWIDEKGNY